MMKQLEIHLRLARNPLGTSHVFFSGCSIIDGPHGNFVKFMFSKKATKIDKLFPVDLTLCSKCQIDGEDFVDFSGLSS